MECVALAGSDKEGEGEIKEKTKKIQRKNILKRCLKLSEGFTKHFQKTLGLLLLQLAKFASS